jgi:predicted dehydrogenase
MKALIVGLGSIASKHIQVLREIEPNVLIYALRSSPNQDSEKGLFNVYEWDALKEHDFDFAIISSPSSLHLEHIVRLNSFNIPLMIEKPLLINMLQVKQLEKINLNNSIMYVACNLRFHPLVLFIAEYLKKSPSKINEVNSYFGSHLPSWRPNRDYRKIYSSISSLGGGVHLDLIHEPDYLVYLFGLPRTVKTEKRKVSNLEIDSYDTAISLFQYEDFQASIVLNYYRKDTKRTLEIIREKDTLLVDFNSNEVRNLIDNTVLFKNPELSILTTYRKQMHYFLDCIKHNNKPMNSPQEAIEILKCIL